jgi:hypothetical protein
VSFFIADRSLAIYKYVTDKIICRVVMMFRLAREIYIVIEAMCSETGRFGPPAPADRAAVSSSARPTPARQIKTAVFIGVMAQEALDQRMAAD